MDEKHPRVGCNIDGLSDGRLTVGLLTIPIRGMRLRLLEVEPSRGVISQEVV